MQKLFENWRSYLNEVNPAAQEMRDRIAAHQGVKPTPARSGQEVSDELGYSDPDSDADDQAELDHMAGGLTREIIEKTIEEFSFNSAKGSQHRWGYNQPIIDYGRNWDDGTPMYTATIPSDNWNKINSEKYENLENFLIRVQEETSQLKLGI